MNLGHATTSTIYNNLAEEGSTKKCHSNYDIGFMEMFLFHVSSSQNVTPPSAAPITLETRARSER